MLLSVSLLLVLLKASSAVPGIAAVRSPSTASWTWEVKAQTTHDAESFTQGLLLERGGDTLLEGSGLYGQSSLRRVRRADGAVLERRQLPRAFFGEGVAVLGDSAFQLTWTNGVVLRYRYPDFTAADPERLALPAADLRRGEGWGLTTDRAARQLVLSDGSSSLFWIDPPSRDAPKLRVSRSLPVVDRDGAEVTQLNELEMVAGLVFANVWCEPFIVAIDPRNGTVVGKLDLTPLADRAGRQNCLNGIAWDPHRSLLIVTGKNWADAYELSVPELELRAASTRRRRRRHKAKKVAASDHSA